MFIKKACPQGDMSVFSPAGILSSISAAIVQGMYRARARQVLSRVMGLAALLPRVPVEAQPSWAEGMPLWLCLSPGSKWLQA